MKKLLATLVVAIMPVMLSAQHVWELDPYHSVVGFTVTHLDIADVPGHFNDYSVTITAGEEDFSDAQIELVVQTASIYTRVQDRDDHLRSADFFHVDEFPEMTFSSTSVTRVDDHTYELTGDLTLIGVTREVTMTMKHRGTMEHPMMENTLVAGIQIVGNIDRSDFGLGDDFPPPMISNTVEIKADGEFLLGQ